MFWRGLFLIKYKINYGAQIIFKEICISEKVRDFIKKLPEKVELLKIHSFFMVNFFFIMYITQCT